MDADKLNDQQFQRFRAIVYREAGINLTEEKRELLNARLAKRLRILKIQSREYLKRIEQDPAEMQLFLDAISTNHTFFFRESKSFQYLQSGFERIWSAASSSGEEAYSLAIHGLDQGLNPRILATDISTACLEKGRRAVYARQAVRGISAQMLRTFFQKGKGQWEEHVRLKSSVRERVRFGRFNLLKDPLPSAEFDLIFCRNVMIYFDSPTKERVVGRLFKVLRPGGYFVIGGAESLSGLQHPLKYVEPSIYLKS